MRGSCHCGAVTIEAARAPAEICECNCSICRRLGEQWAYYRPDELAISGETQGYVWGDRMLALHHCRVCGCITHWQNLQPDPQRMGINARLLEDFDPGSVPLRRIDGASF